MGHDMYMWLQEDLQHKGRSFNSLEDWVKNKIKTIRKQKKSSINPKVEEGMINILKELQKEAGWK